MKDYRSLEHKIRDLMESNTDIRRKVANVGRPTDNVKDDTSKLAKQGEIKTKIIDEESADTSDKEDKVQGKSDKTDQRKDTKKPEKDKVESGVIKGGKTEVITDPKTNDKVSDESSTDDEDAKEKKARKDENKKIGAKGVKEEMTNTPFGLPQSLIDAVTEALKGGQKKLDKNHNGKLDSQDFKMLRKEDTSCGCGGNCQCATKEEVEQVDEVSKRTLANYTKKAADDASKYSEYSAIARQNDDSKQSKDYDRLAKNRVKGIQTAAGKLAKEEVEDIAEKDNMASKNPKDHSKLVRPSGNPFKPIKKMTKEEVEAVEEGLVKATGSLAKHTVKVGAKLAGRAVSGAVHAVGGIAGGVKDTVHDIKKGASAVKKAYKEEVETFEEGNAANKAKKDAAAIAMGAKNRDEKHLGSRGMRTDVADKIRGRQVQKEEVKFSAEELAYLEKVAKSFPEETIDEAVKKSEPMATTAVSAPLRGQNQDYRGTNDKNNTADYTISDEKKVKLKEDAQSDQMRKQLQAKKDQIKKQVMQKRLQLVQQKAQKELASVKEESDLEEARGRKPKNPTAEDPGSDHVVMQLRKVISTRGQHKVTHVSGEKSHVEPAHAHKMLAHHDNLKTSAEKHAYAARLHKSAESMKNAHKPEAHKPKVSLAGKITGTQK